MRKLLSLPSIVFLFLYFSPVIFAQNENPYAWQGAFEAGPPDNRIYVSHTAKKVCLFNSVCSGGEMYVNGLHLRVKSTKQEFIDDVASAGFTHIVEVPFTY